jgi:hypothetical protein
MNKSFINTYGIEALMESFFYLGQFGSVLIPKENERLIRDLKQYLMKFDLKYEVVDLNEYNTGFHIV